MNNPCSTSTRFFPFWDNYDINQLTGLINLVEYIFDKNPNASTWCEIGVAAGESTSILLGFSKIKQLHCIDPWVIISDYFKEFSDDTMKNLPADFMKDENIFLNRINSCKFSQKCIIHKGYSYDILPMISLNFFDVIYIDAFHSYDSVIQDLTLAIPRLKSNGFLCGHDYSDYWPGVKKAVDDFVLSNQLNNPIIFNDTSFLIQI